MEKRKYIWRHPFALTDRNRECDNLSFSNVRLTRTKKQCNNNGWHVSYCFKINDKRRNFESFAHTEYNTDKYKNKDFYSNVLKMVKIFLMMMNNLYRLMKMNYQMITKNLKKRQITV
jgi:hypothetical protein